MKAWTVMSTPFAVASSAADIISCENHPKWLYILYHSIEADSANVRATFDCMQQVGTINEAPIMIAIRSRESLRSIVARGAEPYAGLTNTRTSRPGCLIAYPMSFRVKLECVSSTNFTSRD